MALDRSSAYIFCKMCIISPVLKQKWPKKKDIKMHKKRNFSKMVFLKILGWVITRNQKESIGLIQ